MPKYNQPRKTWQYTNEFKVQAVQLTYLDGVRVKTENAENGDRFIYRPYMHLLIANLFE